MAFNLQHNVILNNILMISRQSCGSLSANSKETIRTTYIFKSTNSNGPSIVQV